MGNFIFSETDIKDVFIIEPQVFADDRGFFMETYNKVDFEANGLKYNFVQDNQSSSLKGVLRGLHYQKEYPQAKLIRVLKGEVFDVAVDLRNGSDTYGKWVGEILSEDNKKQLMIPGGFAHGFLVISDHAEVLYKCDQKYHPEDEGGILWNDPDIGISWPYVPKVILSDKDKSLPLLKDINISF